ncbi:MAG TPA: phage tail tape measure C-terminal domain-containing protein [Candidatus Binatia bacterium]|nr:phage tail tape measure C-terminal domain-containing protein [Candidatus Binatia bacterium]
MNENTAGFDLAHFQSELGAASAALQEFAKGPARRAADDIGASFERAGQRIARAMGSAASGGENAFRRMARVILEELAKIALDQIFSMSSKKPLFGAKAAGGAVNVGGAYLVGERGPELFVPRQAGAITQPGGAVSVHFHLGGGADANAIARHQGQIAAAIARAVAYGRRNL